MDELLKHFGEADEIPSQDLDSPEMKINFFSNQSENNFLLSHFSIDTVRST